MLTVYGLKACDTCRKALKWLDSAGLAHRFHDVRADGLDRDTLRRWTDELGWEALVNRRSTTWRGLDEAARDISAPDAAVRLLLTHPALLKRPVFVSDGKVTVGFTEEVKARLAA